MKSNPPSGTVTFLFTDIEGSTKLAREHPERWEALRARHHTILRTAIEANNGYVFEIIGDGFCAAFHDGGSAINAAIKSQLDLQAENWRDTPIRVRMGIHSGKADLQENGQYIGYLALSRVQRLMSSGHGGQVLVSLATQVLVRDELPDGVSLHDMGEQRLKDLVSPEHIYQIVAANLSAEFPPLKTLDLYRHNLPVQMTSFIGRQKEMADVKRALQKHRLVTLTGSGGTGKTRLSLQVGADVIDQFPDGVWFIELASLTDPSLVSRGVASIFALKEEVGHPPERTLQDYLREKVLLLILDNCEHLIATCAQLTDALLHACPGLKILASSREALGIAGEASYRVPSLSIPDPNHLPTIETLSQFEAVRLFIDRALLVQPSFAVTNLNAPAVAQICQRLDGIPLALELAASRVKVINVEDLEKRLDDCFRVLTGGSRTALPRQQTLRAAIDWSYDLLSQPERILLRRLSIFAGGWTLEVAEFVCADDEAGTLAGHDIFDLSTQLVDKSLIVLDVHATGTRFTILETIRQYAREKLFESGDGESLRGRHLEYFMRLVEQGEPLIRTKEQILWLNRFETECDNLRAALRWSLESGQLEAGVRLAVALDYFWEIRNHVVEAAAWYGDFLARTVTSQDTDLHLKVLIGAGRMAYILIDNPTSRGYYAEALDLSRKLGDQQTMALGLNGLGNVAVAQGSYEDAQRWYQEALVIRRELGDRHYIAISMFNLALMHWKLRQYDEARTLVAQALDMWRATGDNEMVTSALFLFAIIEVDQGHYDAAIDPLRECLSIGRQLGDKVTFAYCFLVYAAMAEARGQSRRGARLLAIGERLHELTGQPLLEIMRDFRVRTLDSIRSHLDEPAFKAAWDEGRALTIGQAMELALKNSDD